MSKAPGIYGPQSGDILLHDTFDVDAADLDGEQADTIGRGGRSWTKQTVTVLAKTGDQLVGGNSTTWGTHTYDVGDPRKKKITLECVSISSNSRYMVALRHTDVDFATAGNGWIFWISPRDGDSAVRLNIRKNVAGTDANVTLSYANAAAANVPYADIGITGSTDAFTVTIEDTGSNFIVYFNDVLVADASGVAMVTADTDYASNTAVGYGCNDTVGGTITSYKCELA